MSKCKNYARFRYTWPGKDESVCCEEHAKQIRTVADAIGLHIQIIPLSEHDLQHGLKCMNEDGYIVVCGDSKKRWNGIVSIKSVGCMDIVLKEYKLYVWEDVLTNWTNGIMFAVATSVEEARRLLLEEDNNIPKDDLSQEPEIVTTKRAFVVWGGE